MGTVPTLDAATTLASGRFLKLDVLEYRDARGVSRKWEAVQRCGSNSAVFIFARLMPSDRVVLIRQYRPPMGAFCLEVPAGLIDADESPSDAALRELYEETGYTGTVEWCGPASGSSAGLTGERVVTVFVTVDETLPENVRPVQHLEETEDIQVYAVPFGDLGNFLRQRQELGDVPDSRLVAWAFGAGVRW